MWIIVVATLLATAGIYRLVVERYCRTSFSSVVSDSAPRSLRTEGVMWRPGVSPTHRARVYTFAAILVCPYVRRVFAMRLWPWPWGDGRSTDPMPQAQSHSSVDRS
ncbi:hypothetical protein C8Q76DRAFT_210941 [Earliella scabrosa]|nr:hypothetical protein C8Q76DRAFT_210941 [Earliella scabrosa]